MSSAGTSRHPLSAEPRDARDLAARLRHPGEFRALALCIITNLAVVALAIAIIVASTDWLMTHPRLHQRIGEIRAIAIAAFIAFPATLLGRHIAVAEVRGNAVRVTPEAYPELHDTLVRLSRVLGLEEVPDLYLGRVRNGPAEAHATLWARPCVLLDADLLFDKEWAEGLDWITFVLAGALGSLRLGHTRWWIELFTAHAKRIPGLRTPLLIAWTYSRDRCGAFAAPDAVRGLLVQAVGKDMIWNIDIDAFVNQPKAEGFWDWLSTLREGTPHLVDRVAALYGAGFLARP